MEKQNQNFLNNAPKSGTNKGSGTKALRYIGSILLLLQSIGCMLTPDVTIYFKIAGFCLLITAISIAPPVSRFFASTLRKQAMAGSLIIAIILVVLNGQIASGENEIKNAEADKSFTKVKAMMLQGKFDSAANLAKTVKNQYADTINNPAALFLVRYDSTNNKEFLNKSLLALSDKEFQNLRSGTFKKVFVQDSVLNASFINTLLASVNQREKLLDERRLEEELAKQKAEYAERQKLIEKQFSVYDGSHRNLEKIIKENMNDEDSYEHIDTRFSDTGDYLIVKTTFSGKNAFNATVKQAIRAKVAIDGTVLSYEVIE